MSARVLLDLFCGRGGWSAPAMRRDWECVGIDIEDHGYCGQLVRASLPISIDRLLLEFKPDAIVASPPCEDYARAWLPWLRMDKKADETLLRWSVSLIGCGVPVVVECSKFAARHVPGSRLFGSYALWGDVPAIAPVPPPTKQKKSGIDPAARAVVPFDLADWIIECFERRLEGVATS